MNRIAALRSTLRRALGLLCVLVTTACGAAGTGTAEAAASARPDAAPGEGRALFAAGCFWCVEEAFDKVPGVTATISGYTGGSEANPTYRQVASGRTGHTEALEVRFDPARVTYAQLLDVFWRNVDPTDAGGQFCDRGASYRSGIFYLDAEQARLARASKAALEADPSAPGPIVTEITEADTFWPAEDYHQDYHHKNPLRYKFYKTSCGRAARLEQLWGS
ncbi:MAG TPA: peptide-methionine (S)-S-oxide reductase MsrA [Pseudomonadales bacterium]|nr:peptide-methionine (S)-S-oxide reductase MsrA [Pseudomonadales bacterium]